ncbi:MAG: hypothetical protein N2691_00345 [Patescibacteria group bacterium]|nr:hypothetical protein [Patescibacteria group bacterium]
MNRTRLFLIISLSILLVLMLLFSFIQRVVRDNGSPDVAPTPTVTLAPTVEIVQSAVDQPIFQESEEYTRAQEIADKTMIPTLAYMEKEGDFRDSVPYEGSYFKIWYDEYQLKYIIQFKEEDETQALAELGQFLQEHGLQRIEDLREYKIQIPRE